MEILIGVIKYINKTIEEKQEEADIVTGNEQFDMGYRVAVSQFKTELEKIKNQIENYIFLEQNNKKKII